MLFDMEEVMMRQVALLGALASVLLVATPASAQCLSPQVHCTGPVVVAQAPAQVVVQPPPVAVVAPFERELGFALGARASAGYVGLNGFGMTGGGGLLRYVVTPGFALELSVDGLVSFDGDEVAVPMAVSGIWFFRRHRRVQPYVLVGAAGTIITSSAFYGGAQAGLGVEILLARWLGLALEARGSLLGSGNDDVPVEAGVTLSSGFNFYI
jgi:hypothetical protein